MKVAVVGLGAVGGLIASRMAAAGHAVSALARGETLARVRDRGLVVESGGKRSVARIAAAADARELGPQDLVVIALKAPALAALAQLGAREPVLVVRSTPTATLAAAERLGVLPTLAAYDAAVLRGCDLLISTLPAGAADALALHVGSVPALLDVVYDPWPTPLAAACGGTVVSGAAMLLHQAAAQVELMTGRPAPLEAMRAALP